MNQPSSHKYPSSNRIIGRALMTAAIMIVVGSAFWAARVTQAEFEVPLVDTTDFVPTEFQSVWLYNRQIVASASQMFGNYEGYAVGKPTQSENGTSALYRFDGGKWIKMLPQGSRVFSPDYHLNAVSGQHLSKEGYAPISIVGGKNTPSGNQRQAFAMALSNYPLNQVNYPSSDPFAVGRLMLDQYTNPDNGLRYRMIGIPGQIPLADAAVPANSELYAVGRSDTYTISNNTPIITLTDNTLAGGMNGWLGWMFGSTRSTCETLFKNNPSASCTGSGAPGTDKFNQGAWFLFQLNDPLRAPIPGVNGDNITGITYPNDSTAFVTTSTLPLGDDDGQPITPFQKDINDADFDGDRDERDCSGPRTGKLFRVIGDVKVVTNWQLLLTQPNECFYGLTVTTVDVPSSGGGPLKTEIWVASSKGIRRVTDDGATYPSVTKLVENTTTSTVDGTAPDPNPNISGRSIYSVASSYQRSGVGQQLLLNGGFQSWGASLNGTPAPSGWHPIIRTANSGREVTSAGTCSPVRPIQSFDSGGGNTVVRIEPGLLYSTLSDTTCSGAIDNNNKDRPVHVSQTVPLTGIEGTRYRVSGRYKVIATPPPTIAPFNTVWNDPANKPTLRQGGVMIKCSGLILPASINCPYANMREIKTLTDADVGAPDPGYTNFAFEFTRTFKQLNSLLTNSIGLGSPIVSGDGINLEIACLATFGARTDCDDLKVEVVSDPVQPAKSAVQVFAVGQDGLSLRNDDAAGAGSAPTTWTIDDASLMVPPARSRTTLNSIVNAGGSHVFAAGSGTSLFQRSIGNLSGYAWLGAAQPSSTPGSAGLGWLSTNCANIRDSSLRSLCQLQSQSYGFSLDKTLAGSIALSGRAWLAKQISTGGTNTDNEGLDLGTCEKPARLASLPSSQPYAMTGSCNAATRTCFNNTNGTRACLNDFDCYGRCTGDQGYLCLTDGDCSASNAPIQALTGSQLFGNPPRNLQCSSTASSPNACSAGGWLTLNATDLPGAGSSPTPSAPAAFGVVYNQSNCTTSATDPTPRAKACVTSADCTDVAGTTCMPGALSGWGRFMTPAAGQCTVSATDSTPRGKTCTVNADCTDVAGSTCLARQAGWVKFRGTVSNPTPPTSPATTSKIYAAQNCAIPSTNALRCTKDPSNDCSTSALTNTCIVGLGGKCVTMSSCKFGLDQNLQSCAPAPVTCSNFCGGDITKPCTSNTECSSVWGTNDSCKPKGYCSTKLACSNNPTKTCTVATAATDCGGGTCVSATPSTSCAKDIDCATGSFCMFGAICTAGAGNSCSTYGIDFDETKGKFQGFAWSSDYGWIDFRAVQKGTNRFLQTRLGDIYTRGNISSSTGALCAGNATYLITATGTISNFCSDLDLLDPTDQPAGISFIQGGVSAIPFSSASNAFTNALGRFDLTGIETATAGVNKYGQTVTAKTPAADGSITFPVDANGQILDGVNQPGLNKNVYTADCTGFPLADPTKNTCRLTQALKIPNTGLGRSGAGILVVKGNLTITNNLQYVNSSIDDLRRLASLVIVVRGNLNIENSVTNLVGAYYVDGTVYTSPEATKDSTENHYPLTVRGLMISKNFIFNRKFAGTVESPLPSELFIFDGRLQSNPLPGMVDFASVLPNTLNSSP